MSRGDRAGRVAVLGLGVTGDAVMRWAAAHSDDVEDVVVVDDRVDAVPEARLAVAKELGIPVSPTPTGANLDAFVAALDLLVPSPGVPERHPLIQAALRASVAVRSEVDLAAELLEHQGRVLVAITGTNGKTTVTELTVAMLQASGVDAVAAGNIGTPLLDEAAREVPAGDAGPVVVAEVSSFQLALATDAFRPRAAALLNLADDHLDWHRTFRAYAEAKAKVFAAQSPDDLLVFNADDPVVAAIAADAPGRTRAFSVVDGATAGFRIVHSAGGSVLVAADGTELGAADAGGLGASSPRASSPPAPHDLANALASAALALDVGATADGIVAARRTFVRGAHRMALVAVVDGVRYVDDSKATNVHAAVAAVRAYDRVVLIAGGRNKGLDLSGLRAAADHVAAVVAIGDAGDEVEEVFRGHRPVTRAHSMPDAVRAAADFAAQLKPAPTAVLLSPACASFDWYGSYGERGDDFARLVHDLIEVSQ